MPAFAERISGWLGGGEQGPTLEIFTYDQAVIEKIRSLRKARKSFAEIADALNTGNMPTRTGQGAKWHPTQVQRILGR